MATDLNAVNLCGRLTKDPEVRPVGERTVTELRLAVNSRRRNGDNYEDQPGFFNVTVWDRMGENCAKYLTKGSQVVVSGRLDWREYEKDGARREAIRVVASMVQFVGGKAEGETKAQTVEVRHGTEDIPF